MNVSGPEKLKMKVFGIRREVRRQSPGASTECHCGRFGTRKTQNEGLWDLGTVRRQSPGASTEWHSGRFGARKVQTVMHFLHPLPQLQRRQVCIAELVWWPLLALELGSRALVCSYVRPFSMAGLFDHMCLELRIFSP